MDAIYRGFAIYDLKKLVLVLINLGCSSPVQELGQRSSMKVFMLPGEGDCRVYKTITIIKEKAVHL